MQTVNFPGGEILILTLLLFGMPKSGCSVSRTAAPQDETKQVAQNNKTQCEPRVYLSEDDQHCRKLQMRLNEAAATGDVEKIKTVFDAGANPNATVDTVFPPINAAITSGNVDALNLFIERGADVNLATGMGDTPLKQAILTQQTKMAAVLIANGAKP